MNIRALLKSKATAKNKQNYERYFKHVIKFHGVKTPDIKEIFSQVWKELSKKPFEEQLALAYKLIESDYAEEKNLAILILLKNIKNLKAKHLKQFSRIIDNHVYDWATCDGLAGRVIGRMLRLEPSFAKHIIPWKNAKHLWRQRAACVSFIMVARFGKHNKQIIDICTTTVKSKERFVQLGTGWVLRELSLADLNLVINFIKKNYNYFSREGLRYAIEKMEKGLRKELLNF